MKASLIRAIENATGESVESLRSMPLDERRQLIEKKTGRRLKVTRNFPFIGRGNVMRDETVSRDQVETELREALR